MALCAAMLFGIASAPVAAQIPSTPDLRPVAILTVISGSVLMRTAAGDFEAALDGTVLHVGAVLRTSADARALITLFEGSTVELDPASDVTIEDATARGGSMIAQSLGRGLQVVMHLTTADSRYEKTTPAVTASVRGVEFEIAVATGLGALQTTFKSTAHFVSSTVAVPTSVQVAARTETTTVERANTTIASARSDSRGERVRRIFFKTLAPRVPSTERSRSDDEEGDREKD